MAFAAYNRREVIVAAAHALIEARAKGWTDAHQDLNSILKVATTSEAEHIFLDVNDVEVVFPDKLKKPVA